MEKITLRMIASLVEAASSLDINGNPRATEERKELEAAIMQEVLLNKADTVNEVAAIANRVIRESLDSRRVVVLITKDTESSITEVLVDAYQRLGAIGKEPEMVEGDLDKIILDALETAANLAEDKKISIAQGIIY